MDAVQCAIDDFIRANAIKGVTDITYIASEEIVKIHRSRKKGRMNIDIPVGYCATPSEVVDRLYTHLAGFGYV